MLTTMDKHEQIRLCSEQWTVVLSTDATRKNKFFNKWMVVDERMGFVERKKVPVYFSHLRALNNILPIPNRSCVGLLAY